MKNKLYAAAGLCILLACIFADGESPWPLLAAMAAAVLFTFAAEKAPVVPKHPDGPRKKRARARRRVKLALVLSVLVAAALGLSWTIHEIEPVRTLPGASALASMLNMQKYNPAEMGFNIEDWPELERVFRSGYSGAGWTR